MSPPGRPLTIVTDRPRSGLTVLRLHGDCDHETAVELCDAVDDVLRGTADRCVTVDMSGVEVCDSSGLSALIVVHRRTTAAGVRLRLTGVNRHLRHLLEVTGLDAHFAEALGSAGSGPSAGPDPAFARRALSAD